MTREPQVLAAHGGVVVQPVAGAGPLAQALALLDRAEQRAGIPLVDETERQRLEHRVGGGGERAERWRPLLAWADGSPVGYGAVVLGEHTPADPRPTATGDAAVDPGSGAHEPVARALLEACAAVAADHGTGRLEVWMRHAGETEQRAGRAAGYAVARRLGVLGRELTADLPAPEPGGATVRGYRPGVEDAAVVAVLAAAYQGTADAGWDLERFRSRTRLPWFRPEDLLVAELPDAGGAVPPLAGVHWLKRRDERTGEVYNLAVHPEGQGRGLGPLLLRAGLAHLREQGCEEVLLWVDLANERAVELYTAHGFATRWLDIALARELDAPG